nr:glycoside hydrolase family 28 protein [Allomuricauda sp.]
MILKTTYLKHLVFIVMVNALLFSCKEPSKPQLINTQVTLEYEKKTSDTEYLVSDHGIRADGMTINTEKLQNLIDTINNNGGGTLVFPKGNYLTGSLQMRSNVSLYLKKDAVLLGSSDPLHYKTIAMEGKPETPKKDDNSQMALLVAYKADNFKIYGQGKIDGQGRALALAIDSLHHAGIKIDPKYNYRRMRPNETARPKLFRFSTCKNVAVLDLNLHNGSCWGLSFELCEQLRLDNLKIVNRAYWNNDGIDITDCKNVQVTNCDVDSADDGICLKSYYPTRYNDSIYIANCTIRSSASAIKFGTASYGGFKNVTIENVEVFDTFRSAIAIESVDGGAIENIRVSNITAKNTGNAIFIRLGHRSGEKPGTIKNVLIQDMKVQVPFGRPDIDYDLRGPEVDFFHNPFPSSITGIPEAKVEDITIENIEISYPGRATKGMAYVPLSRLDQVSNKIKDYPEFSMFGELPAWAFYVRHAKDINFKNIQLTLEDNDFRPAFVLDGTEQVFMRDITFPDMKHKQIAVKDSENLKLDAGLEDQKIEVE